MTARFISLEGGEGGGKSTQIKAIEAYLHAKSIPTVLTREPGGSSGAEEIRKLLVTGEADRWDAETEALLMNSARRDHVVKTIRPALAQDNWVISDRFYHSTLVYQGYAGDVPLEQLQALISFAVGDTRPDLTLVLDLPVEVGLQRAADRHGGESRFEEKGVAFHQRVRDGFRSLANQEPERVVLIDAARPIELVEADCLAAVDRLLYSESQDDGG